MIIKIKNLRVETIIGVHEWEKKQKREVIVNLEMEFDGSKAAATDDIQNTLDYDRISQMLTKEIAESRFDLIEKLSNHLLAKLMADKRIARAKIEIDKPKALKNADSVSVVEEAIR